MKLTIIGAGYVGLTTALCFAEKGNTVICADLNAKIIDSLKEGIMPLFEPGANTLLTRYLNTRFFPTTDTHDALIKSDISLIAVGTPLKDHQIDLSYVKKAAHQIAQVIKTKDHFHTVIVKSTVLPGTCDKVITPIIESISGKKANHDFAVCMHPEFLREGSAILDARYPDRIIIGGESKKAIEMCQALYQNYESPSFFLTNNQTAELIKYTNNAFLATLISFSNDIANLCSQLNNVDVKEVLEGLHLDRRFYQEANIRPDILSYLQAGCGYGGSCLPKDTKALIHFAKEQTSPLHLLEATDTINTHQPKRIKPLLLSRFQSIKGLHIGVLGLTFKPNTDDIRHSPALDIIDILLVEKATVFAHDPKALTALAERYTDKALILDKSLSFIVESVDVLILVTPWDVYRDLPSMLTSLEKQPLFIDLRRVFNKNEFFDYLGIGIHS